MKTASEVAAAAKLLLNAPWEKFAAAPEGVSPADLEATERLILVVALFLSMEDEKLRNAILAEAQNRIFVAHAIGKKPWEV